jgi:hypothetical protein
MAKLLMIALSARGAAPRYPLAGFERMRVKMESLLQPALSVYTIVAFIFACFTLAEYLGKRRSWDAYRTAGILACVIWPLVLMVAAFEVRSAMRRRSNGEL